MVKFYYQVVMCYYQVTMHSMVKLHLASNEKDSKVLEYCRLFQQVTIYITAFSCLKTSTGPVESVL